MIEFRTDILSSFLELVIDHRGKTPKKLGSDWAENGYRAISALNIKSDGLVKTDSIRFIDEPTYRRWMKVEIEKGDILLTSEAPAGEAFLWDNDEKIVLSQRVFGLRVNDRIYNKYLLYYFRSYGGKNEIQRYSSGSTVFGISAKMFELIQVRYPSLTAQKNIGDLLHAIDKKIAINNKINDELESMAKLIYDYWFVQFDFPDKNGNPYKSSGGKMVYNEDLKREIPEGWEVDEVQNLLAKERLPKKIPSSAYLSSGNIPIIDQSKDFICGYSNDQENKLVCDVPRIVFGDHTRVLKLINFDFARGADGTQIILSNNLSVPQHFFYHTLLKIDLSNYGYARHFKFLKESKVIVPKQYISNKFELLVKSFYDQIKLNVGLNRELSELRDWLIPMLMNGQVTIKD